MSNFDKFEKAYAENLKFCIEEYPHDYVWPLSELPEVLKRIHTALLRGSFNKESHAFKLTCKQLGIRHTYTAIKEYLRG